LLFFKNSSSGFNQLSVLNVIKIFKMVAILVQAVYARTSVCSCLFSLVILPSSSSTTVVGAKVGPVIMVRTAVGTVVGPEV
jgi:hypothetical protein